MIMVKKKWFDINFSFRNDKFNQDDCEKLAENIADLLKDSGSKEYCGSVQPFEKRIKLCSTIIGDTKCK